jgi:hypothetical protein
MMKSAGKWHLGIDMLLTAIACDDEKKYTMIEI